MTKIKASDILQTAQENALGDEDKSISEIAAARPSPYHDDLRQKLREKTQFTFGQIPNFIIAEFDRLKDESNCNSRREFLYKLLRDLGADIPEYDKMDGRKL